MDAIEALGLPPSQWIDLDGPVHYREWVGPADGPTFVLVHGLGGSLLNWAGVAPGLAEWGRVVAVDLAGFGLTPLEGRSAGVSANRRLLRGFLHTLELPKVVLVGNSMGGMVSMLQAARDPDSVRALILVDAAFPRGRVRASQFSPKVAALFAAYSVSLVGERVARWRQRRLGAEGLVHETLRLCAPHPERIDPTLVAALIEQARLRMEFDYATPAFLEAARAIFRANVAPAKYRSLVRSVPHPALVIHGDQDRLVPVGGATEAARAHANWTLEVLPGLGHIPQMEAPELWLEKVEAWLPSILEPSEIATKSS
ncbi:MAG TPA: alpha/beta fold hydrolase [Actinomycetota bacterium]|nr:alpha/beta fold hydrolase [Actinomycetota bacterium]